MYELYLAKACKSNSFTLHFRNPQRHQQPHNGKHQRHDEQRLKRGGLQQQSADRRGDDGESADRIAEAGISRALGRWRNIQHMLQEAQQERSIGRAHRHKDHDHAQGRQRRVIPREDIQQQSQHRWNHR